MSWSNPFQRRGVRGRTNPSSALSAQTQHLDTTAAWNQAAAAQNRMGSTAVAPTTSWDSWMNQRSWAQPAGYNRTSWNPWGDERGGNTGGWGDFYNRANPAPADYSDYVNQFYQSQKGLTGFNVDPADQAAIAAEFAIRQKEMQLRQAELDGNVAEATRLRGEIAANRIALDTATPERRRAAHPYFDKAMQIATEINERHGPAVARNTLEAGAGIAGAYGKGAEQVEETAGKIGSGDAAMAAALEIANADRGLYVDREINRGRHALNFGQLYEDVAKSNVDRTIADFNLEAIESDALVGASWDERQRASDKQMEDLERGQAMIDLAKQRDALDRKNQEKALADASFEGGYTDALDYGASAASEYLFSLTGDIPLDRAYALQGTLGNLTDMHAGMNSQQIAQWFSAAADPDAVAGDPTYGLTNAAALGLSPAEAKWLTQSWGVYQQATTDFTDRAQNFYRPDGSKGQETVGGGGEAPANRQHASDSSGPYYDRSIKAESMLSWVLSNFPGTQSAGQWRDLDAPVTADRSANSDHYSGGAIDIKGTESTMQQVLAWAANNPAVAFAKIHGNPRHVHISLKL